MVAVAASPTPGAAAGSHFTTRPHNHPSYKDMILSALKALKDRKGASRHAIYKYIAENYTDLPPNHSSLLSSRLRRLRSKGIIRMSKHSYKLAAEKSGLLVGSKKRGRPSKNAQTPGFVFDNVSKRRGRPRKEEGANASPAKKIKPDQLLKQKIPAVVDTAAVYILPQVEQLRSGFLQNFPGAVAIVLPKGLLSKKIAKNPVIILPNGVQSLVDALAGQKKLGRPIKIEVKKKPNQPIVFETRQSGLPRKKAVLPKKVRVHNGKPSVNHVNIGPKKLGRPRKIRDSVLLENGHLKSFNPEKLTTIETEQDNSGSLVLPENAHALQKVALPELKKRAVGRPKKIAVVEGLKSPHISANAN